MAFYLLLTQSIAPICCLCCVCIGVASLSEVLLAAQESCDQGESHLRNRSLSAGNKPRVCLMEDRVPNGNDAASPKRTRRAKPKEPTEKPNVMSRIPTNFAKPQRPPKTGIHQWCIVGRCDTTYVVWLEPVVINLQGCPLELLPVLCLSMYVTIMHCVHNVIFPHLPLLWIVEIALDFYFPH